MTQRILPEARKSQAAPGGREPRPPLTTQQRLDEVEKSLARVEEYVKFMRGARALPSNSEEAKDAAIAAFHERMTQLERQLGVIAEGLRLG